MGYVNNSFFNVLYIRAMITDEQYYSAILPLKVEQVFCCVWLTTSKSSKVGAFVPKSSMEEGVKDMFFFA
jgi:hypothetical protein